MNKLKPKIIVFASGTKDAGGSGLQKLIENSKSGILNADIAGAVSNYENGGVKKIADRFGLQFLHFSGPYTAEEYQKIAKASQADFTILSGWLKLVSGLNPSKTINIHPGPLPELGGAGMYGIHVSKAAIEKYKKGELLNSAVSMHFVTEQYDKGPIFFKYPVAILDDDTPEDLFARVNKVEHGWQSFITSLVVTGQISWDGKGKVIVPDWYRKMPFSRV